MKMRELFSPIPKEIFRKDDVRERVEIFLVLFVVAGLGYKFVKGSIKDYLSLDDPDVALAVFVNALLADLMGHESIETTRIYLRRSSLEQQEIIDRIVTW